ncbi:hypothetical protein OG539_02390 [Actinacidiphila glaucinigra]|uniref:hypothetical protein n=1 Tax=Actinacidiphila glaucinigra TaxID=235986 RepID=UPI0032503817
MGIASSAGSDGDEFFEALGHSGAAPGAMGFDMAVQTLNRVLLPHTAGTTGVDPSVDFSVVVEKPLPLDARVIQLNTFERLTRRAASGSAIPGT